MAIEPEIVKSPQDARQGRNAGVKNVLIAGLVLVVVAFLGVYLFMR